MPVDPISTTLKRVSGQGILPTISLTALTQLPGFWGSEYEPFSFLPMLSQCHAVGFRIRGISLACYAEPRRKKKEHPDPASAMPRILKSDDQNRPPADSMPFM
jgi:hypothetical protein